MANKPKRIGEQLLEAGLINQSQLLKALERQKSWGGRLGSNLVLIGAIKEHDLMRFMAIKTGVREMNITDLEIAPDVVRKLPQKVVEKFHCLPVYIKDKKTLVLALADPTDLEAIDQVSFITGMNVEPVVASYSSILQAIHKYYFGFCHQALFNQNMIQTHQLLCIGELVKRGTVRNGFRRLVCGFKSGGRAGIKIKA